MQSPPSTTSALLSHLLLRNFQEVSPGHSPSMKGAVSLAEETRQEIDNLVDKPDSLGESSAFDPATSGRVGTPVAAKIQSRPASRIYPTPDSAPRANLRTFNDRPSTPSPSPSTSARTGLATLEDTSTGEDDEVIGPQLLFSAAPSPAASKNEPNQSTLSMPTSLDGQTPVKEAERIKSRDSCPMTFRSFENGQPLEEYQVSDLQRLLAREMEEKQRDANELKAVGYILAYGNGFNKMATCIALIACNPPPEDFQGARVTLIVVQNEKKIREWELAMAKFAPDLRVSYHNFSKAELEDIQVVLISYERLRMHHIMHINSQVDTSPSNVFRYTWFRQINGSTTFPPRTWHALTWFTLDEIDQWKSTNSRTAEAICANRKQHGICLTTSSDLPPMESWSHTSMDLPLKFLQAEKISAKRVLLGLIREIYIFRPNMDHIDNEGS